MTQVVKFDEWRWKVSYGMPVHGKDFWGKKADEREKREEGSVKGKRKRFSWRRRSRRKGREKGEVDEAGSLGSGNPNEMPTTPSTPFTPRRH